MEGDAVSVEGAEVVEVSSFGSQQGYLNTLYTVSAHSVIHHISSEFSVISRLLCVHNEIRKANTVTFLFLIIRLMSVLKRASYSLCCLYTQHCEFKYRNSLIAITTQAVRITEFF